MGSSKNIHLITSMGSGGTQKVLYEYLKSISDDALSNILVFSIKKGGGYRIKIERLGVPVYDLCSLEGIKFFLLSIISSKGYVKAWMYHACFLSILFKVNFKRDIFWSIHHGKLDFKTDSISTIVFALASSFFSWFVPRKIIFVSDFCLNQHLKVFFSKRKSVVIYNCVMKKGIKADLSSREKVISFVGRDHPNKNLNLFLLLCERLESFDKNIVYYIVGDGTDKYADKYKNNSKYIFWGEVSNIYEIFSKTNVYVCTSYVESFGLSVVEAIFTGCHVVCPNESIFKEISDGKASFYRQDDLDDLVCKVSSLVFKDVNLNEGMDDFYKKYSKESTFKKIALLLGDK